MSNKLADAAQGASRGFWAGNFGAPVDLVTMLANLGLAGGGYAAHKLGLVAQPPALIDSPVGGSDWIAAKMRSAGLLADNPGSPADAWGAAAGGLLGPVTAAYSPQIARGLLATQNSAGSMTYAARSAKMRAPPQVNEAGFWNEYKAVKPGAASGERAMVDIDGRPIDPRSSIAGLGVVDGPNVGISGDQARAIAQQLGIDLRGVPAKEIGRDAGRYLSGGGQRSILLDNNLVADQVPHVMRHELGHAVDDFAGAYTAPGKLPAISPAGQTKALAGIYDDLNNRAGPAPIGTVRLPSRQSTPATDGYKPADHDAERMAEAMRAYLTNPAYIKTVAPGLAAKLRKAVNENPNLKHILTLNSAAGAGLLGYGASGDGTD